MTAMRHIFDQNFSQHYQPIVDLESFGLVGHEALLRQIPAGDTFSVIRKIEKSGMIADLDLWSLQKSLDSLELHGVPGIAVNVSARSVSIPEFADAAAVMLNKSPLCERISFEITESEPIHDIKAAHRFVVMAKQFGCDVGLDDFGDGHARFKTARDLSLTHLKLSSRLTKLIGVNARVEGLIRKVFIESILCGMYVIGEHIETALQCNWLKEVGIDMGQGWLFGRAAESFDLRQNYRAEVGQAERSITLV